VESLSIFQGSTIDAKARDCQNRLRLEAVPSIEILESLEILCRKVASLDYKDQAHWPNLRLIVVALFLFVKQNEITFKPVGHSLIFRAFHFLLEPYETAENNFGNDGIDDAAAIIDLTFLRDELADVGGEIVATELGKHFLQTQFPDIANLFCHEKPAQESTQLKNSPRQLIQSKNWQRPKPPKKIRKFFEALESFSGEATSAQIKKKIGSEPSRLWQDYPKWESHLNKYCEKFHGFYRLRPSDAMQQEVNESPMRASKKPVRPQ